MKGGAATKGVAVSIGLPKWLLVDIGINLTSEMYLGNDHHGRGDDDHTPDIDLVVARAAKVGVTGLLITGGNLEESKAAIQLAHKYHVPRKMQCMATVGCHPTRCSEFESDARGYLEALDALISEHSCRNGTNGVVRPGECNLDYDRLHFCLADVQQSYFALQFELAKKHRLPMFFHDSNTNGDFERIVREHRGNFTEGVVHSFTGTVAELMPLLEMGLYVSLNGCGLKTSAHLEMAKTPLDRLLIETDGPYCEIKNTHASREVLSALGAKSISQQLLSQFPVVNKKKFVEGALVRGRNEPCTLVEVLEVLYELRKPELGEATIEDFAAIIQQNTARLFGFS
ncbi:TatD-related deoxyribonuclease, putative [Bodo saltans]|uniref:TatD-related deoxyribonuclease, putative n=1 Tax=Bodo saltans TaxID=75058 RepID=A0A0S4IY84_BODSA|nr:TatD-related deoxyribonuclease, putative [Bodo saltans]|eukprot:CUG51856.1 TatD-related deoxyribonuclease, putative [Bodo saltans]